MTDAVQPLGTAELITALRQQVAKFKGLERALALAESLSSIEQRITELGPIKAAAEAEVEAARTTLAEINATAEAARGAARAAAATREQALADLESMLALKRDGYQKQIADAEAAAKAAIARTRADAERQVAELAAAIAAKRDELAGVEKRLAELRAMFAPAGAA